MKAKVKLIAILVLIFSHSNCANDVPEESSKQNVAPVKKSTSYVSENNAANATQIADTIIYDVVIKNASPEDEWQEFCLKNIDRLTIANIIFNAVYNGRLTAYDYQTEEPMTIDQVKDLENKYDRNKIAKMQFIEEWYIDEEKIQMGKKVNEIMLAYELVGDDGEIRGYKAGIKVYLHDKSKNPQGNK